jgi:hypothetical protein
MLKHVEAASSAGVKVNLTQSERKRYTIKVGYLDLVGSMASNTSFAKFNLNLTITGPFFEKAFCH